MFSLFMGCVAFAGVPGFVGVSAIVFSNAFAAVSAVDGVLAAASFTADPGVPTPMLLSGYRNIEYQTGEFEKLSNYRISNQGLNQSDSKKFYRLPVLC
jgi:hypothetical protein